ncbi:MAG: DUF1559 domain-containing protein [Planctomycetaceae bacterium]
MRLNELVRVRLLAMIFVIGLFACMAERGQCLAQERVGNIDRVAAEVRPESSLAPYLISDFVGVAVLEPGRLPDDPGFRLLPPVPLHEFIPRLQRDGDLRLEQVERIAWAVTTASPPGPVGRFGPPPMELVPAVVVRFRREIAQKDVDGWFLAGAGRNELHGSIAPFLADDRTVIVAPESILKKMLDNRETDSLVRKMLRNVLGEHDLVVVADVERLQADLQSLQRTILLAGPRETVPVLFAPFLLALDDVRSGTITASAAGRPRVEFTFVPHSDEGAENLQAATQLTRKAAALMFGSLRQELVGNRKVAAFIAPPDLRTLLDMGEKTLREAKVIRRENSIAIEFVAPADYEKFVVDRLAPMLGKIDEGRREQERVNRLKEVGLAMHNHHATYGSLPQPVFRYQKEERGILSWRVAVLMFLEHPQMRDAFRRTEAWDSDHNKQFLARIPSTFRNTDAKAEDGLTSIVLVTGPGTAFAIEKEGEAGRVYGPQFADIRDGTSNTLLAIELPADKSVPWTKPADFVLDSEKPLEGLGKIPPEGLLAVMMDGAVRRIPPDIKPADFKALCTCAGGEIVSTADVLK